MDAQPRAPRLRLLPGPSRGRAAGFAPPTLPEFGGAAGGAQGLSCCLVTAAAVQKCTLLQPASQTNGFERNSCSFRIIFILFFLKKKKKKSLSAPALLFFSALFPRIWSHKGGQCHMPGGEALSSSSPQGLALIIVKFQAERKQASASLSVCVCLTSALAEHSCPFLRVIYFTILRDLVW